GLFCEELFDGIGDLLNLPISQLSVDRQAQALTRRFFRHRKITLLIPQRRIAFLQMQRQGIMKSATNSARVQMFLQLIAARMSHHVKMPGALRVSRLAWKLQRRVRKELCVNLCNCAPAFRPLREMFELYTQHRALNAFHAVVEADFIMIIS